MTELRFIEQAPGSGERRLEAPATVGREDAEVELDDPEVSRRHAEISLGPEGDAMVEDLGSSNGTWVNEVQVKSRALRPGDQVRFGKTVWRYEGPVAAPVSEGAPATRIGARSEVRRGDVPVPPDPGASAVRTRPVPDPVALPDFHEGARSRRGSAATRTEATAVALAVLGLDTAGLVVFFLLR